jgi:hypothetical protein
MLAVLLVAAGSVAVDAATPEHIARTNRITAAAAADRLLAEVVLPAGSTRVATAPANPLLASAPFLRLLLAAQVDRHAFWTTGAAPSVVVASVKAHLPAGAKAGQSGYSSSESFVAFTLPTIDPAALAVRQLVIEAVSLASGTTVVRADAEVQYIAPRPRDEQVPRQARVLEITMKNNAPKPLLSLLVTNRARVRQIASIVNALPFAGNWHGTVFNCPSFTASAPTDTFLFRATADGHVLATVTELAATPATVYPCLTTSLTIGGRRQPELMDGGVLLRSAGSLLGVKLTRP